MATMSTEDVFTFIENELARHSLAGNSGELRQIRRITAFLAHVAKDVSDSASQERFLTLFSAADALLNDKPSGLRG